MPNKTSVDLDQLLLDAVALAHEAGKVHLDYFRTKDLNIQTKLNQADIVTAADKAAENVLISGIHARYPLHSILSEESGEEKRESDFEWVIDPLDGTTNFSTGLPYFSVSIGVKYQGETIVGVVYAPYLNELFTAIKGEGAYLNGEPIKCGTTDSLDRAVVATGFPVDKNVNPDNNLHTFAQVLPLVRGMRRLGSAAIDISYVSAGFLDAYWELNLHEWDVCAALLIADEAGARWRHFRTDRNISVMVASPAMFDLLNPMME